MITHTILEILGVPIYSITLIKLKAPILRGHSTRKEVLKRGLRDENVSKTPVRGVKLPGLWQPHEVRGIWCC